MNELYDSLPIIGQNLACTVAGFQKMRSRYGRHFNQKLAEWRGTIDGPMDDLLALQSKRLQHVISRAGGIDATCTILSMLCIELWCRMFLDVESPKAPERGVVLSA